MNHLNFCYNFILAGNAAGRKTPPLLVFQGKRMPNQINSILPENWHAEISESGWMTSEVFFNYVSKIFYPWLVKEDISTPVLFLVDGHVSHRSLKLSEFCAEKDIILVSLLPNTTHICQPMDVVVYAPLKNRWSQNLQRFKTLNETSERMSKKTFCEFLAQCVDEVCTPQLLQMAFRKTGLSPFDADSFDYSRLSQNSSTVQNVTRDEQARRFLRHLEEMVESAFPNRLREFKSSDEEWFGAPCARDLFTVWKAAGGIASREDVEADEEESYELVDIVYSNNPVEQTQ